MSRLDTEFVRRLTDRLGKLAQTKAYPKVAEASFTLANAMQLLRQSDTETSLYIPHYWALYVHDGRGPFGPVRSKFIVFFRVPLEDPRLRGGVTPERAKDIKRLTRNQWKYWLRRNREARARGETPPMVVLRYVKRRQPGRHFFGNGPTQGMHGFGRQAGAEGQKMFREHLRKTVPDIFRIIKDTAVAK